MLIQSYPINISHITKFKARTQQLKHMIKKKKNAVNGSIIKSPPDHHQKCRQIQYINENYHCFNYSSYGPIKTRKEKKK